MVDNKKIFVEADFENVVLVDPNKVVNRDGTVEERLVNHEELMMYANLEARTIPRTKLALGSSYSDSIQNVGVGQLKVNFLKGRRTQSELDAAQKETDRVITNQTKEPTYMDTSWTDQFLFSQRQSADQVDTQLLGITRISIKMNPAFVPTVTIEMTDVQGRVLFEYGDKSPYSLFFQLPYPIFILTVKGYYGKAIKLELMLKDFNARFDPSDGSYKITTNYVARSHALLSDTLLDYLYTVPKMYEKVYEQELKNTNTPASQNTQQVGVTRTTKGREKLSQVYSIYKEKGLIDQNFPEITFEEMKMRMEYFTRYIMENYTKEDMTPLTDIVRYDNILQSYRKEIYSTGADKWSKKYVDRAKVLVLNNGKIVYPLKSELSIEQRLTALKELKNIIERYNNKLLENSTFGGNGKYEIIGGEGGTSDISVNIKTRNLITEILDSDNINYEQSYIRSEGKTPTDVELAEFTTTTKTNLEKNSILLDKDFNVVENSNVFNTFITYGEKNKGIEYTNNSFLGQLSKIDEKFREKKEEIEKKLSEALANKVKSTDVGIGFAPTINNVIAVICAAADAFYRLMDDVHKNAWEVRDNPKRLQTILSPEKFSVSQEGKNPLDDVTVTLEDENGQTKTYLKRTTSVYPWPLYFEKETDEDGNEVNVQKYPGQPEIASTIESWNYSIWPEVEFVEEYVKGSQQKGQSQMFPLTRNERQDTPFISANAIEFPFQNPPYINLDHANVFYEIWERTYLASNYTQIIRNNNFRKDLYYIFGDFEAQNVINATESDIELRSILKKQSDFSAETFIEFLRSISNDGAGGLWNNKIRDIFNKTYIQNELSNNFGIYNIDSVGGDSTDVDNVETAVGKLKDYIVSTESNETNFLDVYPFVNLNWINNNLANGQNISSINLANSTTKVMNYMQSKNTLSTFLETDEETDKRLYTYFAFKDNKHDSPNQKIVGNNTNQSTILTTNQQAINYYNNREISDYFLTETKLDYNNNYDTTTNKLTSTQTNSLLNTPYFVNAISKSVQNVSSGITNPHVSLGYLYLNSLPLPTLSEKYITKQVQDSGKSTSEYLDYIFAGLKKYSAIHKLPYMWILKYGSIWHRYKEHHNGNGDILDGVWQNFDYVNAYDPITNDFTKSYTLKNYTGGTFNYFTEDLLSINFGGNPLEKQIINNGLYPKVINDIYKFFTKKDVFTGYTTTEWDDAYTNKKLRIGRSRTDEVPSGYDINITGRSLSYGVWYQYFDIDSNISFDNNSNKLLIVPSAGHVKFNQSKLECFNSSGKITQPIQGNQSVQNGSVRSLWAVSNYGYFNNDWIKRPSINQYIKLVDNTQNEQEPFSFINSASTENYKSIDEIFAVFSYEMLEEFEKHFLNFCKPNTEYSDIIANPSLSNQNTYDIISPTEYNFNIEEVMRSIFIVDKPSSFTQSNEITDAKEISNSQIDNFVNLNSEQLLEKDIIFKNGNPGQFNRRVFGSFSTNQNFIPVDPITFGNYVQNSLPTSTNATTLSASQVANPDAWNAMYLYVGDYEGTGLKYSDSGSTFTDFFVDFNIEFTEQNVIDLNKIIKMYGAYKLNGTGNSSQFRSDFNNFITLNSQFQNNIINHLFFQLRKQLPEISETRNTTIITKLDGNISKNDIWSTFKNLNDRWVSGQDFSQRTIFEEFLFLDKANRPIGDKVIIDIQKFKNYLKNTKATANVYQLIGQILQDNNFIFMPTPSYANFYGRQSRSVSNEPDPNYGEIASNTFGTFLEVDTHGSEPKFLAIYVGKVSEVLSSSKDNQNFLYPDDSFLITKDKPVPISSSEDGVTDYSNRNKVVGFNVDFGVRNQGIFKSINLDMAQRKNIGPTFQVLADMGSVASGQKSAQQTANLYNFYKNGSYNCTVSSIGNAMIQPTMYFNLRYVPMFYGAYLITSVNHDITTRDFATTFEGVRIPKYALQMPDNLVQSINDDIVQTIKDEIRRLEQGDSETAENNRQRNQYLKNSQTQSSDKASAVNSKCNTITRKNVDYKDRQLQTVSGGVSGLKNIIQSKSNTENVKKYMFGVALVENSVGSQIKTINYNLFNLRNDKSVPAWTINFDGQVCIKDGDYYTSYISFDSFDDSVTFFSQFVSSYDSIISAFLSNSNINGNLSLAFTYIWYYTLRYTQGSNQLGFASNTDDVIIDTVNYEINKNENAKKLFNKAKSVFASSINKWDTI